jgi:hypothetical protein
VLRQSVHGWRKIQSFLPDRCEKEVEMFFLKVFIMGLIALVDNGHGSITLVLQSTSGQHEHFPVLIYPCGGDCTTPGQAIDIHRHLKLPPNNLMGNKLRTRNATFGGVLLAGQEVTFSGTSPGQISQLRVDKLTNIAPFGEVPLSPFNGSDFSWIPQMKEISPLASTILPDVIYFPSAAKVSGLVRLSGIEGIIKPVHFASVERNDGLDWVVPVAFRKSSCTPIAAIRRALPDVLMLRIPINSAKVKISVNNFTGGTPFSIDLSPRAVGESVDILVGNLTPVGSPKLENRLEHFGLYYELAENAASNDRVEGFIKRFGRHVKSIIVNPPLSDVVKVVSVDSGPSGGGLSRPMCTFVTFQAQ